MKPPFSKLFSSAPHLKTVAIVNHYLLIQMQLFFPLSKSKQVKSLSLNKMAPLLVLPLLFRVRTDNLNLTDCLSSQAYGRVGLVERSLKNVLIMLRAKAQLRCTL